MFVADERDKCDQVMQFLNARHYWAPAGTIPVDTGAISVSEHRLYDERISLKYQTPCHLVNICHQCVDDYYILDFKWY